MKLNRLIPLAAAVLGTAAFLTAGPDSRTFMLPRTQAKTAAAATVGTVSLPALTPANVAVSCATCACCKKA